MSKLDQRKLQLDIKNLTKKVQWVANSRDTVCMGND